MKHLHAPALAAVVLAPLPLAQEAASHFDTPCVVLQDLGGAPFQRLLDLDGDGDLDAVGSTFSTSPFYLRVRAWRNDGTGALSACLEDEFQGGSAPQIPHLEVGDMNGDGSEDFVVGGDHAYWTYTAVGDGGFTKAETVLSGSDLLDLQVADLDADGLADLALLRGSESSWAVVTNLEVRFASGSSFVAPLSMDAAQNVELLVAETDGDASLDLLVRAGVQARAVSVTAAGATVGQLLQADLSDTALSWATGDVDGDGDCDAVAFQEWGQPKYVLFRRTGAASWSAEAAVFGGPGERLVDADGDGDLDAARCGPEYLDLVPLPTFKIALNDGAGGFAEAFEMPAIGASHLAGAGDLDGDGDVDLVAGRVVYYARGPLSESPLTPTLGNPAVEREWLLCDRERDGDVEYAYPNWPRNLGDGSLGSTGELPLPPDPAGEGFWGAQSVSGDFTGDGAVDWIYSLYVFPYPYTFVQQMLIANNGGGGWEDPVAAAAPGVQFQDFTGESFDSYVSADVDVDGDVDVLMRSPAKSLLGRYTRIFCNDGSGYFALEQKLLSYRAEAVADLDADGMPDLVSTDGIEVPYAHQGLGIPGMVFGSALPVLGGYRSDPIERPIDVSDLNDDGLPDVAFLDPYGLPRVLVNVSPGPGVLAFTYTDAFEAFACDGDGARIVGMDVDVDGRTDVVVGPLAGQPGAGAILLRTSGTGQILTSAHYAPASVQMLPRLIRADMDGDGDVDLLGDYLARNLRWDPTTGDGACKQIGTSIAGTGAMVPTLGMIGPFRAGSSVTLQLSGAPGGTLGMLVFSPHGAELPGVPFPGHTLYVDPFLPGFANLLLPVTGAAGDVGGGTWQGITPTVPVTPALAGWTFHHQAFLLDAGAPSLWTHTNDVAVTFGLP